MDSQARMSLRAHRPRDYTVTESEHPEEFKFSKGHYSKEYVSPALQLNTAAKMFTKFINSINKQIREKAQNDDLDQKAAHYSESQNFSKDTEKLNALYSAPKKNNGKKKQPEEQLEKDKKPLSKHKAQNDKLQKSIPQPSPMSITQYDPKFYKMIAQLNQAKAASGLNINSTLNMEAITKAINHQQSYINNSQLFSEKEKKQAKSKLFRRSSYHVAIAYHIHLKKVYEEGGQISQKRLDPTYEAKKLRGGDNNRENKE